jgi:transcriptional regulator with XRE-family HTH domain
MTLADYLKQDGHSATALAQRLSVSVSTITRAASGTVMPGRTLLKGIFDATNGAVTPNDFVGVGPADARAA